MDSDNYSIRFGRSRTFKNSITTKGARRVQKTEALITAFGVAAPAAAGVGVLTSVDSFSLVASLLGGFVGALITARDAFNAENKRSIANVALAAGTSFFVGACIGFLGTPVLALMVNPAFMTDPVVRAGVSFFIAIGGERFIGPMLKKLVPPVEDDNEKEGDQ